MEQSRSYPMGVGGPHPHGMMDPGHMGSGHVSPMLGGLDPHGASQKEQHPYHMGPS